MMSVKPQPDEPVDQLASSRESRDALLRCVGTFGRTVGLIAALASVWTIVQFWIAREFEDVAELRLPAAIVYAAGLGYLGVTAVTAWRAERAILGSSAHKNIGSLALAIAHTLVLSSAVVLAWRGVSARGSLVGLGAALVAWGVVALLAIGLEWAVTIARRVRLTTALPQGDFSSRGSRWAPACLACAVAIGLSLAYLESHPLPNSPTGHPIETKGPSDQEGVVRQESPSKGNEEG